MWPSSQSTCRKIKRSHLCPEININKCYHSIGILVPSSICAKINNVFPASVCRKWRIFQWSSSGGKSYSKPLESIRFGGGANSMISSWQNIRTITVRRTSPCRCTHQVAEHRLSRRLWWGQRSTAVAGCVVDDGTSKFCKQNNVMNLQFSLRTLTTSCFMLKVSLQLDDVNM